MSPRRIVSLAPSVTEIVCMLGAQDALVGVDRWSDHPEAVRVLPKVGGIDADIDAVTALRPDLVIGCRSVPGMERNVARLANAGIEAVFADPVDLDSTLAAFRVIGAAIDREAEANALVDRMRGRIAELTVPEPARRPRVYWEWWPKPLSAAAGESWMSELITRAGGSNVFEGARVPSVRPTDEDVIGRDPEVICLCWCGAKKLPDVSEVAHRPGWAATAAVRRGRVFAMPEGLFARPGPRLVDGLERLARSLAP